MSGGPGEPVDGRSARFERAPCGLLTADLDGIVIDANETVLGWLGRTRAETLGRLRVLDILTPGGRAYYQMILAPLLRLDGEFREIAARLDLPGGAMDVLLSAAVRTVEARVTVEHVLFPAEHRRLYERELAELTSEARRQGSLLKQVEKIAGIGTWTLDVASGETTWSDQLVALSGLAPARPGDLTSFLPPDDRARLREAVSGTIRSGQPFQIDSDLVTAAGEERRVRIMGELDRHPEGQARVIGVLHDITDSHRAAVRLWRSANFDELTDLPNRRWFQERLAKALGRADACFALAIIDLDGFKEINDSGGHRQGDAALRQVARRIVSVCGGETCARLGGDEFAVLIEERDRDRIGHVANRLIAELQLPMQLDGTVCHVGASVGIARYPEDGDGADPLLRSADLALYTIKTSGKGGFAFYSSGMAGLFDARKNAVDTIRAAHERGAIVPFYQPKVRLSDGRIVGHEALVRVVGEDGQILGPAQFGAALKDPESIRTIQGTMFEKVLLDLSRWKKAGFDPGRVSINASEFCLHSDKLVGQLLSRLEELELPTSSVEIEITEVVLFGEAARTVESNLVRLHRAGVAISLDDFGTGYASLTHLRDFPIDCVKIDKSFVLGLGREGNTAIVKAIVDLSHNLGKVVVAEGIETQGQRQFLEAIGCDTGQGFLFGRAVPAGEVSGRPRARSAARGVP